MRSPFMHLPTSRSAALEASAVRRHCGLPTAVARTRLARTRVRRVRKTNLHQAENWYRPDYMAWKWTEFWETVAFTLLGAAAAAGVAVSLL